MELLFESRTNIRIISGQMSFFQTKPDIHPEPVLVGNSPGDSKGISLYGSVLNDGGRLRMWYYAVPEWARQDKVDFAYVAYAESEDGIHWRKPVLNLVKDCTEGCNLTNFGMHSATVFIDPDSPSSHRYRGVGTGNPHYQPDIHNVKRRGYYTLHSSDGFDWKLDSPEPRWQSSDVITSIYHPKRRAGMIAMKYSPIRLRMIRRSIHQAEFCDGIYSDETKAIYPDEFDDMSANMHGFHSCDYYGMGMMPAGTGTVGFVWKYWHALPYTNSKSNATGKALYGKSDICLVYQERPGDCWMHLPGRPVFIGRDALPWTQGWINSAANVVDVGNEQRLYYSGLCYPHGYGLDENWEITPAHASRRPVSGITYASWPKNRLFGFESLQDSSFYLHLGQVEEPSELFLNYEVIDPDGSIRAELAGDGIPDRTTDECVPMTGNELAAKVRWQSGTVIPASPAARVILELRSVRLYSYELRSIKDSTHNA